MDLSLNNPIGSAIDLAKTVVSRIWPDKTEEEKAQLAATLAVMQGQLAVNQAEASTGKLFIAGWRPFIGWVCGSALAWNWIGISVLKAVLVIFHQKIPIELAPADLNQMLPIIGGMLGVVIPRTVEKLKGVAAQDLQGNPAPVPSTQTIVDDANDRGKK